MLLNNKIALILGGIFFLLSNNAFSQSNLTDEEVKKYEKEIIDMVEYVEGTFNFLGGKEAPANEKEIVISNSYSKVFRDSEVQIEDDLDEARETPMNKDIQSYLQDIDFFFKEVEFTFDIESITYGYNENKELYFTVTLNRNLKGVGIKGNSVNNNKPRYIEISVNETARDLKIISFYTTKLDETADLRFWWDNLPKVWQTIFTKEMTVTGKISNTQIKNVTNIEEVDISGNQEIKNLLPLIRLTKLRKVNCANTKIDNVDGLRNLINLESLDCSNTKVSSFEALKYTTNLRNLYFNNTLVSDITQLENFIYLQQVQMNKTLVTSLNPLEWAEDLVDLRFNETNISSISILKELENIESIYANDSKLSDISIAAKFIKLSVLDIGNTAVSTIKSLSKLQNLQKLNIDNTKVSEIESLTGIKSLVRIYCDNTAIKQQQASLYMQKNRQTLVMYDSKILFTWWKEMPSVWKKIFSDKIKLKGEAGKEELQKMANIQHVDVKDNKEIKSLAPLSKLNKLESLDVSGTAITNLMPLLNLLDLTALNISKTGVETLNPLLKLTKIQSLDVSSTSIVEILALEHLTNLENLTLDNTKVASIAPLKNLKNLKVIYADKTLLTDEKVFTFNASNENCLVIFKTEKLNSWWNGLDKTWKTLFKTKFEIQDKPDRLQIHKLIQTKELSFSGDEFKSIAALSPLKNLEILNFSDTRVTDLTPIEKHKNIKILKIQQNPGINNLSPISSYSKLEGLDIQNTLVKDLSPLRTIISLKILKINGTKVITLKSLVGLSNLQQIEFFNTNIWFLKPLYSLKKVEKIKCYNTKISKFLVEKFKTANPKIDVVY